MKTQIKPKHWHSIYEKKVIAPNCLQECINNLKQAGRSIATLNGSFDILHAGHLHILYEASQQGDCFIVALNSDASIQTYKDPLRPIIPLNYRIQMMAAIEFVSYVTWFDETDPRHLLSIIRPDVHVNGSNYGTECIEAETVRSYGGRLHLVKLIPGLSTSEIIKKIKET